MNNEDNRDEGRLRELLIGIWGLWPNLIDRLPDWMFAPKAELPPEPPDPTAHGLEIELYESLIDQRKDFHGEISKTIRRVFYMLVGTCLFCVITLAGSPDIQLLTPDATVKLPILNYDMGFQAFLVVGPVILIALTIYLHIFVGQHRMLVIPSENRQPILPNFNSWTAKLVVLVIFYWITPIVLAVFTWKAWPQYYGHNLQDVAIVVTAGLVLLQIRRCPREWRTWVLPLLIAALLIFVQLLYAAVEGRHLNLYNADLSEKDLRDLNLNHADLKQANLSGANLTKVGLVNANLTEANLSGANLTEAALVKADLTEANLSGADLTEAVLAFASLPGANLAETNLSKAYMWTSDLTRAHMHRANLSGAEIQNSSLTGANLSGADLTRVDLSLSNLTGANLSGADLTRVDLSFSNLTGANLTDAIVEQVQLEMTCGDKDTRLPEGLSIKPCPKDQ